MWGMLQRSRSTDTSLCKPFTTTVPSTCGSGRYTNHQIPVPAAITRIVNIESKNRRTLRKCFLSHSEFPIECRRRRNLRQRPTPGICLLLQCGRGLRVYVCAALGGRVGADWPEWIFCRSGVFRRLKSVCVAFRIPVTRTSMGPTWPFASS